MTSYNKSSKPDYLPKGGSMKDAIVTQFNIYQLRYMNKLLTWIPEGEDLEGGLSFGFWILTDPKQENLYLAITSLVPIEVFDILDGYREINYDEKSRMFKWFIEKNISP